VARENQPLKSLASIARGCSARRQLSARWDMTGQWPRSKTSEPLRHLEPDRVLAPISHRPDDTLHPAGEWQRVVLASGCELPSAHFSNVLATRDAQHGSRTSECVCLPPRQLTFASADVTCCGTDASSCCCRHRRMAAPPGTGPWRRFHSASCT
jgi:hypothetical protein